MKSKDFIKDELKKLSDKFTNLSLCHTIERDNKTTFHTIYVGPIEFFDENIECIRWERNFIDNFNRIYKDEEVIFSGKYEELAKKEELIFAIC